MSWRITQHYGFGAASVELAAEPHYVAHRSLRVWPSMRDAGRDFYTSSIPPLLMACFMIVALFVTVSKDKGYTDLEVVMIGDEMPLAEAIPEPEPVVPEPEPVPEKEPEPPPPPVKKIAEKKPEPPPPVKKIEPPKPPPVKRIARKPPPPKPQPRSKPVAKPEPPKPVVKPAFSPLAMQPEPVEPPPARRGNRVREQVKKPKVDLAPLAAAPKLADASQPERSRRFAAVRAAPKSRPRADLGPPIAARALDAPAPEAAPARTRRAAPRTAAERRVAKVSFAAGAPVPDAPKDPSAAARRSRTTPRPEPSRPRAAPPPMEMAAAAPAAPRMDLSSSSASRRTGDRDRTERNASSLKRSDHTGGRQLAGVPLASLAACVSDGEEDALKRRLLAAVTTQRECVSRAGTYRFVETKNLNAFLMTIERSAGRPEADRCVELEYALECVSR